MDKIGKQFVNECADNNYDFVNVLRLYVHYFGGAEVGTERYLLAHSIMEMFMALHRCGMGSQWLRGAAEEGDVYDETTYW